MMKIEEAIKQKTPFRSEKQRAAVNLIYTHNWLIAQQKAFFRRFDITLQQYNVLRILRGQYPDPISTSDIRSRMLDKMSDVSRIVDRLVKKKLVERRVCKSDKRLVDVLITANGLSLLDEISGLEDELERAFGALTVEEVEQFNLMLDKLRSAQESEEDCDSQ